MTKGMSIAGLVVKRYRSRFVEEIYITKQLVANITLRRHSAVQWGILYETGKEFFIFPLTRSHLPWFAAASRLAVPTPNQSEVRICRSFWSEMPLCDLELYATIPCYRMIAKKLTGTSEATNAIKKANASVMCVCLETGTRFSAVFNRPEFSRVSVASQRRALNSTHPLFRPCPELERCTLHSHTTFNLATVSIEWPLQPTWTYRKGGIWFNRNKHSGALLHSNFECDRATFTNVAYWSFFADVGRSVFVLFTDGKLLYLLRQRLAIHLQQ